MEWSLMLDSVLKAILIPLLPLLGLWAKQWVTTQIESLKDKNERDYFDYHLGVINELIVTSVGDVKQVLVDGLKKEGKFTIEKQKEVLELAKEKVMNQLTVQSEDVLKKTYADYLGWIEDQIENVVGETK